MLLTGCITANSPTPEDTKFNESNRNWLEIYRMELEIAVKNEDLHAIKFFLEEIYKEKERIKN